MLNAKARIAAHTRALVFVHGVGLFHFKIHYVLLYDSYISKERTSGALSLYSFGAKAYAMTAFLSLADLYIAL